MPETPPPSTITQIRQAIAEGHASPTEVVRAVLDRIAAVNPSLNVFHEVYEQRAMTRAEAVEKGEVTGPLAGVPIAIKDVLCTDFGRTTCGSKMLADFHAPYTATAVQRLEDAGAIIVGKTNMDEFAMGSSTENCAWGPTLNPWDTGRVPGGSSGGAAAAMAAGLCFGSIGSDTGGSIRQPAALCGVVGLKPTYGRVSRFGLIAFASSLDQIGPFTRTVADAALLLHTMGGRDPRDSTSADVPLPRDVLDINEPPKDGAALRIGLPRQYFSDANHPAVRRAVDDAAQIYRDAGAELVEVDLPHTKYGIPTYYIVATAEASSNLARFDGVHYGHRTDHAEDLIDLYARSRAEGFGDEVKRRIMLGTYALSSGYYDAYYNRALKVRRLIKNDFDAVFDANESGCDAILCPTTTAPAFKLGEKSDDPLAMYLNDVYTVNCNLAGIAGISLPAGFAEVEGKRLPVGVQLLGPAFGEVDLLRIARMYERETQYWKQTPGARYDQEAL